MISEEQFKIIETHFGNEVINIPNISINHTEYVKIDDEEEKMAFPDVDDMYGVICFMNEGDDKFFTTVLTLLSEFMIQYEAVMTRVDSHQTDYGDFIDICFMDII